MVTEDGVRFTIGTKSLFDTPIAYTTEYLPTSVQIGGSDTLSTCFLGLQVNGHYIDWLKKKSKDHVLPIACESQSYVFISELIAFIRLMNVIIDLSFILKPDF